MIPENNMIDFQLYFIDVYTKPNQITKKSGFVYSVNL